MTWLSPSFPVGSFSYSHGMEQAVEDGLVTSPAETSRWISDILMYGAGITDTAACAAAGRAYPDKAALRDIADLATALSASRELRLEATGQGRAFWRAATAVWPVAGETAPGDLDFDIPHAVAVGWFAAGHDISLRMTVTAYAHAFAANLVAAAVKLVPLGQTDGLRCMAALEPVIQQVVEQGLVSDLEQVRTSVSFSDICSMRHETQKTRLFRS
ncbi:MAG: urease accessory UreF family protein [Rhodospirillales bacterium]